MGRKLIKWRKLLNKMTNWKVHKYASMTILGIAAASLMGIFPPTISSLSDKLFNMIPWSGVLAAGLLYVMYSFYTLIRA